MSVLKEPVKPEVFQAIMSLDVLRLKQFPDCDIRPILPCLVRMALCAPVDSSETWALQRKDILQILTGIEVVNSIVALLSIDFNALEQDVKKEHQLRSKIGSSSGDSVLVSQLQHGLVLEFERSDPARRIRLLLSEIVFVLAQVREGRLDIQMRQSEIFEAIVYLDEVSDIMCIAQAELPSLSKITELAEAFLFMKNGQWLLCRLLANSPDSFTEVCEALISKGEKQEEDTPVGLRRMEMLKALCHMNQQETLNICAMCVKHCTMPGVAVYLTIEATKKSESDLMSFVSGLLMGDDINSRQWFAQFIRVGQKRKKESTPSMLTTMRQVLLMELNMILPTSGSQLLEQNVIKASGFIRLYCALKTMALLKFSDFEVRALMGLITSKPPISFAGGRFVTMALCMLISSPTLLSNIELERECVDWMKWLMNVDTSDEGENCNFGEMLYLIAIHFHGNQTHAISELVSNTLGMKSTVKANNLSRIRQIFTQELFTEQVIAQHTVKVPVTQNLNADIQGYLPLHSVFQLLKSRAFSKHKVPIKDWIYAQLRACTAPIHPLLTQLIDVFVNSILVRTAKSDYSNEPISEQQITDVFSLPLYSDKDCREINQNKLAPQLLILYYVLLYEDTLLANMKALALSNRKVTSYSEKILSSVSINFLIQEAHRNQHLYASLFSPLLRLLLSQYPHLCLVEDWIEESVSKPLVKHSSLTKTSCTPLLYSQALHRLTSHPMCAIQQLEAMMSLDVQQLMTMQEAFVDGLSCLLFDDTPRKVLELVKSVWFKFHAIDPRRLRLVTVNAFRPQVDGKYQTSSSSENDITVDPLIILRCDDRIFRCPPLLEIVLKVLEAYMQACRVHLNNHLLNNPVLDTQTSVEAEHRDLKNALISAQESAIVQILLECCLQKPGAEDQPDKLNNVREIRCLICSFLHQIFIADPNIAKLVHFQGYPSELLPITAAGIPSMHICIDFIPELISQPQIDKQIFAIEMISHLCGHYAVPKSLSVAKLAVNVMFTMVAVYEQEHRVDFFVRTVPCLVKVAEAFPPLCEDITSLLLQLGKICATQIRSSANCTLSSIWRDATPDIERSIATRSTDSSNSKHDMLYKLIQMTFAYMVEKGVVTRDIYS